MATNNVTIKRWDTSTTTWDIIYPKTTADNIISGTLAVARIPDLAASKITNGTFDAARIPDLDAGKITSGTFDDARIPSLAASKITSGFFSCDRIPNLLASKITSGKFDAARIPDLSAGKITSGTFDAARIPDLDASKITSGTFDAAHIPALDASKITSGIIDAARLPAIAITDVTVSTTMAAFLPTYSSNTSSMQEGDVLILTTDNKTYIHNGGTLGTAADFTQMATPTDVVTSVAGKTGVVTLSKSDVGLGSVTNHAQIKKSTSSTTGYIPTWSVDTGDALGTGYAVSGTGSVAMTNNPAFTGTPTIGTGSDTWKITDETPNRLEFINGGTVILPKVSTGEKTIAFEEDVQSAITLAARNRAVISDTDGKLAVSSVTSTELGYLSGLKVNVQTGKQHHIKMGLSSALPSSSTFNGDIYLQTD